MNNSLDSDCGSDQNSLTRNKQYILNLSKNDAVRKLPIHGVRREFNPLLEEMQDIEERLRENKRKVKKDRYEEYRRQREFGSEARESARRLARSQTKQMSLSPPQKSPGHATIFTSGISREKNNMFGSQTTPDHIGPGFYRVQPMETIYKNVDNVSKSAIRLASRNAYTGS